MSQIDGTAESMNNDSVFMNDSDVTESDVDDVMSNDGLIREMVPVFVEDVKDETDDRNAKVDEV